MKKIFKTFFAIAVISFFGFTASAATPETALIISNINIEKAKVLSQNGSAFNVIFHITNKEGVISGVKYGIKLVKEVDKKQFLADEYIYPEVLTILPNSDISKDLFYKAPEGVSGKFAVLVSLQNENGTPLGLMLAGDVSISATAKGVEILPETCYLNISGESFDKKYGLMQGVDIKDTESIILNCKALNSGDEITLTPSFETYLRNSSGEKVKSTSGGSTEAITFKAGELATLALALPIAQDPQAYDVVSSLSNKDISTNKITVHYVLKGLSSTINNLSIDKLSYEKGDKANLSFTWAPSADNFPGSRYPSTDTGAVSLSMTLRDGWKNCIKPIDQVLDNTGNVLIQTDVISKCSNPTANVILKDATGKTLASKEIYFGEDEAGKMSSSTAKVLIAFGILVVAGFALYFINLKKNKKNETIAQ